VAKDDHTHFLARWHAHSRDIRRYGNLIGEYTCRDHNQHAKLDLTIGSIVISACCAHFLEQTRLAIIKNFGPKR